HTSTLPPYTTLFRSNLRDELREEIFTNGVNPHTGAFTQTYDNTETDASLLQIPQTGFVDYDDPHMLATVEQVESDLLYAGLPLRSEEHTSELQSRFD